MENQKNYEEYISLRTKSEILHRVLNACSYETVDKSLIYQIFGWENPPEVYECGDKGYD